MQQSSAQYLKLAQQMLVQEAIRSHLLNNLAESMNMVCQRLYKRLNPLIGAAGYHALLTRAVSLAKNNYAWLDVVRIAEEAGEGLQGLNESIRDHNQNGASISLAAILSNMIWLLVSFIGEDIVLKLIKEIWPEISVNDIIAALDSEKSYE